VQLVSYQESPSSPSRFKGLEGSNPPAPELVRLKKGDPNRAIAFDYELTTPNQYAGVGVEVMDTPAACRTFNILLAEGRNVIAALIV